MFVWERTKANQIACTSRKNKVIWVMFTHSELVFAVIIVSRLSSDMSVYLSFLVDSLLPLLICGNITNLTIFLLRSELINVLTKFVCPHWMWKCCMTWDSYSLSEHTYLKYIFYSCIFDQWDFIGRSYHAWCSRKLYSHWNILTFNMNVAAYSVTPVQDIK